MKFFVAILALAAFAAADVSELKKNPEYYATILKSENDVSHDGFAYTFETQNGIVAQETGALKSFGPDSAAVAVQGSNAYTGPDGVQYALTYIADDKGYQPQGAHLPTPPPPQPIPDYILRALQYIEAHPPAPEPINKGSLRA